MKRAPSRPWDPSRPFDPRNARRLRPVEALGEAHEEPSERTHVAPAPAGLMADLLNQQGRRPTPPPPPPVGDGIEWFLALDGGQQGPFSRKLLVDRLLTLPKDADLHVWNDKMDGWKPPKDVPDIAHDLAARKPPAPPARPPVPRTTPSPPLPPTSARRGTQPLSSGIGAAMGAKMGATMSLPTPHVAAGHSVPAPHHAELAGPATPPPMASHSAGAALGSGAAASHGSAARTSGAAIPVKKTNGVSGAHAVAPAASLPSAESDALSALNIDVGPAVAKAPAAAPRIMELGVATAWSGADRVQEGRHRNTKMILGLLGVGCVIIVVLALAFNAKKAPPVVATTPVKGGLDSDSLDKLHARLHDPEPAPPPQADNTAPVQPQQPEPPAHVGKGLRGRGVPHGRPGPIRGGTSPTAVAAPSGATPPTTPAPGASPAGTGFTERAVTPHAAVASRPPPSQAEITRVIANNKIGIKTCYQRALLRDSSLTHGKIVVGVTIGLSGRVKGVHVDGPSSFRTLEPCIKEMVGRWTFPQSSEEYGTEFSYLFQGNE